MSAQNTRYLEIVGGQERLEMMPSVPLLGQTEIIGVREGGLVECYVPTDLIDHEEVPVKEEWASSIAKQMREIAEREGGSGQQSAIQLGFIDGEDRFKIIDGFHRDRGLLINGEQRIYSTVRKTDWNTLYDSRIFTAKDHVHVRFSRVVQWIREVWEYSGLSDKMTVQQAVLLYRFDTNGEKLKLDPVDVLAAKAWVARKEDQWGMAAMSIHHHLQVAANVDPRLVHSAREKRSGHVLEAPTQSILGKFSKVLPGEENFGIQNLIMEAAIAHNLRSPQVQGLCERLRGKDLEYAREDLETIDLENYEPVYSRNHDRQLRRASDPRYKGAAVLSSATRDVERILERVRITIERKEEIDETMLEKLKEAQARVLLLSSGLGELAIDLSKLTGVVVPNSGIAPQAVIESVQTVQTPTPAVETEVVETEHPEDTRDKPEPRNRLVLMTLPDYGKFTKEDWSALEPHIRFALALNHDQVTLGRFSNAREQLGKIADIAVLTRDGSESMDTKELIELIRPLVALLTHPKSPVGNVIRFNKAYGTYEITETGEEYLRTKVKEVLLEVDESRRNTRRHADSNGSRNRSSRNLAGLVAASYS